MTEGQAAMTKRERRRNLCVETRARLDACRTLREKMEQCAVFLEEGVVSRIDIRRAGDYATFNVVIDEAAGEDGA